MAHRHGSDRIRGLNPNETVSVCVPKRPAGSQAGLPLPFREGGKGVRSAYALSVAAGV
jgi:hypothetical protein